MLVLDNFLSPDALAKLNDRALWQTLASKETNYCTSCRSNLEHPWERLTNEISTRVFPGEGSRLEYWANVLISGEDLDWHKDKDETLYEKTGSIVCPQAGAVFYGYPHEVLGGLLQVKHNAIETETLLPIYNRLILFDISKDHRVSPVVAGTRYGFQVNLW